MKIKVGYMVQVNKFTFQPLAGEYEFKRVSREEFDKLEQTASPKDRQAWNQVGYPVAKIKGKYVHGITTSEEIFYWHED